MSLRFDVLTLFPNMFDSYLAESMLAETVRRGLLDVYCHNMRAWANDRHQTMDDRPFGGGPGMVLKVDRVVPCVEDVQKQAEPGHLVMLTPQGRPFTQRVAEEFAGKKRILLLCGRYEGFDQRITDLLAPDEVSLGDFVLNGGEVAAMAIMETVMRLLPGALGKEESALIDSFSSGNRLLKDAQYTRPREYRGLAVPDILLSGNHEAVDEWRRNNRLERTRQRRSDLLEQKDWEEESALQSGPNRRH